MTNKGVLNVVRLAKYEGVNPLTSLAERCKQRMGQLKCFLDAKWENQSWPYLRSNQELYFTYVTDKSQRTPLPEDLALLAKVFMVKVLWAKRLRNEPYSMVAMGDFLLPLKILAEMGVGSISEITPDVYDQAIGYLPERYEDATGPGRAMNRLIRFANENNLLDAQIDTKNIRKTLGKVDEHGREQVVKDKMPLPELVRAIIHLKWRVEDQYDGSFRAQSDKLSVLTQAFQYGLGLRLGEVLRLPVNPLIEKDGDLFCLVWTEKGSMPMARYVPKVWRPLLTSAVEEIQAISAPYRARAKELEQTKKLHVVEQRLQQHIEAKKADCQKLLTNLQAYLAEKKREAESIWQLKKEIADNDLVSIYDLGDILPIHSKAKDSNSLVKTYKTWGLEITSKPTGKRKKTHWVSGAAIGSFTRQMVEQRASHVTINELLNLIHGGGVSATQSKDTLLNNNIIRISGTAARVNFHGLNAFNGIANASAVIPNERAIEIISAYTLGGYDHTKYLTLRDFELLFPELVTQKTATLLRSSGLNGIQFLENQRFYVKSNHKNNAYVAVEGLLIESATIHDFLYSQYISSNYELEQSLMEAAIDEYETGNVEGINISSASFITKQKVSDFLFLRAGMRGGQYDELTPQILSYYGVLYFFNGNERAESAFERYGLDIDSHILESWQSHKGRHWQTTSLFRSGLSAMVVNKWMGRTETQGSHYDHNTGSERAAQVGELMLEDQKRYLGDIPDKVRSWQAKGIPTQDISEHLSKTMQSIQHSPLGFCIRSLNLKPCELNLKCLTGKDGNGCKHFIFDLYDKAAREKIVVEKDKSTLELSRLFEVLESGVKAAEMHIEHHMVILKNTSEILEQAQLILEDDQLEELLDFMPFKVDGSYPDDCPFQCGENT